METLLFQVAPTDLRIFVYLSVLLLLVVAAAALIPDRHAGLHEPVEALRNELLPQES